MLGFVAVLCFALALSFNKPSSSVDATELICSDIKSEYYVGDELVMPATVSIAVAQDVTVNGSNGVLVFPDGTVHNSSSYVFEMVGEYQAVYYATYQGRTVKATKNFKVLSENWVLSSGKSSISYSDSLYLGQVPGISVQLAEGDAFVFDQRINIYDVMAQQGDLVNVISFTPEFWTEGNSSVTCNNFTVKVVDYYDPTNYVEFHMWANAAPYTLEGKSQTSTTYSCAGASDQKLTGLEWYTSMSPDRIVDKFDGRQGRLYKLSRYQATQAYGAVTTSSSSFVYPPSNASSQSTSARTKSSFKFNMVTGEAFCGGTFITNVKSEYVNPGNVWEGFTTGEVYVEVQCYNYKVGAPINIEISNIFGIKGEALNKAYVRDNVNPVIKFDTENTDENGVYVERGREVVIPNPTVYDINYEGDLETAVYYNYNTSNPILVYMKDNKFTPTNLGKYTAVYTASDKYGNKTVATYDMNAINEKQFTYAEEKLPELSGATINQIPDINVVGINSYVNKKVIVVDPKGNETDVTDTLTHEPEYIGNYTVKYVFSDNVTSETFSYQVESKEKGYLSFRDGFKVSNYLIKDAVYDFNDYYVYKATANGLQPVRATIQASVDGAEFANIANLDAYKIVANDTISFKAVSGTNSMIVANSKVVDVGYNATNKDYTAFFQGADSAVAGDRDISYNFLAGTQVKKLDFINPLLLSSFQIDITIPEGSTFNDYRVTLSEFGTPENKITVQYTTTLKGTENLLTIRFIDADGIVLFEKMQSGSFAGKHSLFIKEGVFNTTEGVSYSAPNFADYRTMVSVELISDTDCSLSITKIGNQNFNGRIKRSSEAKPQLYYTREFYHYVLGTTVKVPVAYAISTLSPVLEKDVTVSVTNAEGTEYVSNNDGVMKDLISNVEYEFELSYIGSFKVVYTYSANAGKNTMRTDDGNFVVNCTDSIDPEILFEDGISENIIITLKAGKTHKIKMFTVSDNETAVENIFVRVQIFNENHITVAYNIMDATTYNGEYTFEEPGNYYVQVYAQDQAGNYAIRYYNICVLED